jgi:inner membrane protein
MDNLTHSLTGLALARAGLDRLTPRASLVLLVAVNVPDIDVVTSLWGAHVYLDHHRGITHSLLALPIVAALPVIVTWRLTLGAYLASFIGVLSHLLMDWTNIYGIRLLTPVSERWFRLDIISVIDPWIWAALALAALWPLLARLVSGEIGGRSHAKTKAGVGLARATLAFLLIYAGARFILHERALAVLDSRLWTGRAPVRVAAFPTLANPMAWTGLVELSDAWVQVPVALTGKAEPGEGTVYYKSPPNPAASATPAFAAMLRFSQFPIWRSLPSPAADGSTTVEASDLRFGVPGEGRFAAVAKISASGQVIESRFQFGPPGSTPRPK